MGIDFNGIKVQMALNKTNSKEIIEKTGIRAVTLSNFCTGKIKRIPVDFLEELCKTLHCQPADLITYTEDEE